MPSQHIGHAMQSPVRAVSISDSRDPGHVGGEPGSIDKDGNDTATRDAILGRQPGFRSHGPKRQENCAGLVRSALLLLALFPLAFSNYAGVLSAGYYHTCGVYKNGEAHCWGDNSTNQSRIPTQYARFQIFSNRSFTNGSYSLLFDWNRDDSNGSVFNFSDPALGFTVEENITWKNISGWKSISAGYYHTCGLSDTLQVFCWGTGKNLQALLPQWIMSDDTLQWRHVSCGTAHTCGILANGSAHCWGANDEGQSTVSPGVDAWRQIDAGYAHTCGVAANGSAFCWGWNGVNSAMLIPYGQATPPKLARRTLCDVVPLMPPLPLREAGNRILGFVHSCGVSSNGTGYCWGKNDNGQTDLPAYLELPASNEPGSGQLVPVQWRYIDASYFHSCGITVNGRVLCWGTNDAGQTRVPNFLGFNLVTVTSGFVHNCVLNATGTAFCWGPTPHGSSSYWFLGQTKPPANHSLLLPSDTTGDYLSPYTNPW